MTFCPTGENFRSARCARGKKAHFCIFFHRNVTESIPSRRKYHKSGKKCRHLLQPNHPKLVSYVTYLLGPQISSHLSRHDMTCLSGAQISSHLSRFISDKSPPKIESFVERIVATKRPWARPHRSSPMPRTVDDVLFVPRAATERGGRRTGCRHMKRGRQGRA